MSIPTAIEVTYPGLPGVDGSAGPAPSGTGFVKVVSGVLQTPAATIPATDITGLDALTYAGDDPNIPENLTITGITDPASSDPLVLPRGEDNAGYASWYMPGSWSILHDTPGTWWLDNGIPQTYATSVTSDAISPVGLTFDEPNTGAGLPVITGDAPIASFIGQLCKTPSAWWVWNGTAWIPFMTLVGEPVAYNATLATYRKLTISGADGSETITISPL